MSESCNSRHFSWLMKSCFPNPKYTSPDSFSHPHSHIRLPLNVADHCSLPTTVSSLPNDLLLECLSRVPPSSLPALSLVCLRWARLLQSPYFFDLRRRLGRLENFVFAVSATDSGLYAASLRFHDDADALWKVAFFLPNDAVSLGSFHGLLSHARLSAVGHRIFIIGRNSMVRYDTWSGTVVARSAMIFPRKKFATAVVSGKIYAAGGGPRTSAVEEYNPDSDTWRVVAHAPRKRYGCIGASVDGVFYVIGGLKIGASVDEPSRAANAEAHVYASSMDLYDVEARTWLRSRAVPGGGCVVAACAAAGHVYVLASHAVELSFWRFDARRRTTSNSNNGSSVNSGFGEWCRLKSPPLLAQVRLDCTVRFSCVGVGVKVVLVQVTGCIDDLLRRSGRGLRGLREGLVLLYDSAGGDWSRGADLPEVIRHAACVSVEC
ncbi:F-box/kelch-repeat protein At5g26960-like [Juglans regia]|uniref:F-box/kelch-repeat protein At5g26960-like n=1 Tax=Juglans regia TaxID=51240 RepID=A0A6P9EMX9_JUGRE|nr:F-box/kelch-repeat protein At5g26960-like [Juglans regia]